jgi:CRP-like cAMP-binding protein
METLETMIKEHPFWAELAPKYLHLLNECASIESFRAGQQIFQEGANADKFYLLESGYVSLETFVPNRGVVTIQTLGPGDALGWSWLFPPTTWKFSARALDATQLIAFDAAALHSSADENHDFGYELLTRMTNVILQRLQATRQQLKDFQAGAG